MGEKAWPRSFKEADNELECLSTLFRTLPCLGTISRLVSFDVLLKLSSSLVGRHDSACEVMGGDGATAIL